MVIKSMKRRCRRAFAIDDLSPSGYGSDLIVTIEEADGTKRTFSQPFSSVVQMLRPALVAGILAPVRF
ncbi:hypothetical protein DMI60_17485 [Escherichia coli]|nr:hypothetical protein [Escherichia coli]